MRVVPATIDNPAGQEALLASRMVDEAYERGEISAKKRVEFQKEIEAKVATIDPYRKDGEVPPTWQQKRFGVKPPQTLGKRWSEILWGTPEEQAADSERQNRTDILNSLHRLYNTQGAGAEVKTDAGANAPAKVVPPADPFRFARETAGAVDSLRNESTALQTNPFAERGIGTPDSTSLSTNPYTSRSPTVDPANNISAILNALPGNEGSAVQPDKPTAAELTRKATNTYLNEIEAGNATDSGESPTRLMPPLTDQSSPALAELRDRFAEMNQPGTSIKQPYDPDAEGYDVYAQDGPVDAPNYGDMAQQTADALNSILGVDPANRNAEWKGHEYGEQTPDGPVKVDPRKAGVVPKGGNNTPHSTKLADDRQVGAPYNDPFETGPKKVAPESMDLSRHKSWEPQDSASTVPSTNPEAKKRKSTDWAGRLENIIGGIPSGRGMGKLEAFIAGAQGNMKFASEKEAADAEAARTAFLDRLRLNQDSRAGRRLEHDISLDNRKEDRASKMDAVKALHYEAQINRLRRAGYSEGDAYKIANLVLKGVESEISSGLVDVETEEQLNALFDKHTRSVVRTLSQVSGNVQ